MKDAAVVPGAASATSRVEASTRSFDRSRRGNAPIFNDDPAEGATRDANADANAPDGAFPPGGSSPSSSSSSRRDDDEFARSSDEHAHSDYYSSSSSSDYSSSLGLGGVASFVARARAESDVSVHFSGSGGLVVEDVGSDEEELKLRNARKGDRLLSREGGKLAYEGAWVGGDGAAQTPEAGGGDEEKTTRNPQANAEAARHSTTRSFDPKLRKTDVAPYGMSMEPGGGRAVTRRRVGGSAAGEERRRARVAAAYRAEANASPKKENTETTPPPVNAETSTPSTPRPKPPRRFRRSGRRFRRLRRGGRPRASSAAARAAPPSAARRPCGDAASGSRRPARPPGARPREPRKRDRPRRRLGRGRDPKRPEGPSKTFGRAFGRAFGRPAPRNTILVRRAR